MTVMSYYLYYSVKGIKETIFTIPKLFGRETSQQVVQQYELTHTVNST